MQGHHGSRLALLAGFALSAATACDHHPHDVPVVDIQTVCGPSLERYPVAGPYNNGWDHEYHVFTCDGARAGSDYYTGVGPGHPAGHLGNDIFAARGASIVAATAGTVAYVRHDAIGGRNVGIVDDCGWTTYYAHLESIDPGMVVGRRIGAGTAVGTMGDSGSAQGTAVHLHFSLYPDGVYGRGIDPFPLLQPLLASACHGTSLASTTCGDLAGSLGWQRTACEWNGNGVCDGRGPTTADCEHCCDRALLDADLPAPEVLSCGDWGEALGYQSTTCEWNDNGACDGRGAATADCDACCDPGAPGRSLAVAHSEEYTCGDWARMNDYAGARCEWNDNGVCGGRGPATADCDHCCDE